MPRQNPSANLRCDSNANDVFYEEPTQPAELAALDWLEGQARITRLWLDILISRNARLDLIEKLEGHKRFLESAMIGH